MHSSPHAAGMRTSTTAFGSSSGHDNASMHAKRQMRRRTAQGELYRQAMLGICRSAATRGRFVDLHKHGDVREGESRVCDDKLWPGLSLQSTGALSHL